MKVIICGTRKEQPIPDDYAVNGIHLIQDAIKESGFDVTEIIHGGAKGIDAMAHNHGLAAGLMVHPVGACWKYQGLAAGPIRNQKMVDMADACIAIPDKNSTGTWDTVRRAKAKGIPVYISTTLTDSQKPQQGHS